MGRRVSDLKARRRAPEARYGGESPESGQDTNRATVTAMKTGTLKQKRGQVVDTCGQSVDMNHAEKSTASGVALNGGTNE